MILTNDTLLEKFLTSPRDFGPPRLHGNGFIQVDLDETTRFHVWDLSLPRQKVSTQIHDHRFDFESHVLLGTLNHDVYTVYTVLDPHLPQHYRVHVAEVREGPDTMLTPTSSTVSVVHTDHLELAAGSFYTFPKYKFHESGADQLTATMMSKLHVDPTHNPRVLVPLGEKPDNDFNRYGFQESELWDMVENAVDLIKLRR